MLKLLELIVQSASHPVRQVNFNASVGPSYVTANHAQLNRTREAFLNGGTVAGHITVNAAPRGNKHARRAGAPLAPASSEDLAQAQAEAPKLAFPLYYPVSRVTSPFAPADMLRSYMLNRHVAYVVVVAQGGLGQYYDLEGTTWQHPPILNNPSQTIQLGGRLMQVYFEGRRIRLIAWRDGGGVYWLVNTLGNVLSNRQMLAIAAAAKPVP